MGDLAHEPETAAAIDEADMVLGQEAAEGARGLGVGRIPARARAAINADILDG